MKFAALVLAAGASRRMGFKKTQARVCERSLLEIVADAVLGSRIFDKVVIVVRPGDPLPGWMSRHRVVEVAYNSRADEGLSASLKLGFSRVEEFEGVAVFHSDTPLLDPGLVRLLAGEFVRLSPDVLVPTYLGSPGFPVFVSPLAARFSRMLTGDSGLRRVFSHLYRVVTLETGSPGVVVDVDTPRDLHRVGRLLGCVGE